MALRSAKKVSFLDTQADLTPENIQEIQRENYILKGKLFEMEEFCEKAEKCLNQNSQSIQQIQEMTSSIETLKASESKYKQKLKELENHNSFLVNENKTLRNEISDLRMKKKLLESEIERLSESVHAQEIELRKMNLKKISNHTQNMTHNPNLVHANPAKPNMLHEEVSGIKSQYEANENRRDSRNKLPDHHIEKMRKLATRNLSCKNINSQSFSFTSPPTSPKPQINPVASSSQLTNVEELKRLIRQAKENHMRLKTTF